MIDGHAIKVADQRGRLCVPKTCANWADACGTASARSCERCLEGGLVRACDDLRLVGLKLIFLIVTRAVSVLGLSRREAWWKDAEILMLRHQLAVSAWRSSSTSTGRCVSMSIRIVA
jgi:hypothetical protein